MSVPFGLVLAVALMANLMLPVLARAFGSPAALFVYDSRTRKVGQVLDWFPNGYRDANGVMYPYETVVIQLAHQGISFPVAVTRDAFVGLDRATADLYFELPDCQGRAWELDMGPGYAPQTKRMFPRVHIGAPGNTVYLVMPNASAETVTVSSLMDHGDGQCSFVGFAERTGFPVIKSFNLQGLFTPPFSVR